MSIKRKLSEFGAASNGGGIEGVLRAALDNIDEGGTLIFDAVRFPGNVGNDFEYAVFSPVIISKSVLIEGESSDLKLVNKTKNDSIFDVRPNKQNFFFAVENLKFISGSRAVSISGSFNLSPNSRIYNVAFWNQISRSLNVQVPEINLHLENVHFKGNVQYGAYYESHTNHDYLSVNRCKFEGSSIAGFYFTKSDLNSGSVYVSESEFLNNSQAIVVNNVRYYEHNVEYIQNEANYVLSGAAQRLTASGGGGGGGGVTDHGQLTGLGDDDHKIYLLISGTRGMSGSLNMNGHNITAVGTVDGRDVSVDGATLDSHILDTNNPHATSLGNLDPGTLAELNALIIDADIPSEANFNSLSSSFRTFTGSINSFTSSINSFTSSVDISATFGSIQTGLLYGGALSISASSFVNIASGSGLIVTYQNNFSNYSVQRVSWPSFSGVILTYLTSSDFSSIGIDSGGSVIQLGRIPTPEERKDYIWLGRASHANKTTISFFIRNSISAKGLDGAITDHIISQGTYNVSGNDYYNSGSNLTISKTSGEVFRPFVNSATNLKNIHIANISASNPIASFNYRYRSGSSYGEFSTASIDPNNYDNNGVLTSVPSNRWTIQRIRISTTGLTIVEYGQTLYSSFAEALGGLSDTVVEDPALTETALRKKLVVRGSTSNLSDTTNNRFVEITSDGGVGGGNSITDHGLLSGLTDDDHLQYLLTSSFNSFSSSMQSTTASLLVASATFRSELNTLTNASATFRSELTVLNNASATFRGELNLLNAASSSYNLFSASHAARHLSGGADPIDAQSLRSNGIAINRLLISDGVGGWTTVHSSTVAGGGGITDHGALTGLGDNDHPHYLLTSTFYPFSASMQSATASLQTFSGVLLAASATFRSELNILTNASASFRTELNSLTSSVVRLDNASATFRTELNLLNAASSSYNLFSASHAARHLSGGADPIDAQSLRSNGIAVDRLLISNGVGGWTTVHSSTVAGGGGVTDHGALTGLADDDHPQYLLRTEFNPFSASMQSATASLQSFSATLLAASATFRTELNTLNNASASFATVSATFSTFSASYVISSASFAANTGGGGPPEVLSIPCIGGSGTNTYLYDSRYYSANVDLLATPSGTFGVLYNTRVGEEDYDQRFIAGTRDAQGGAGTGGGAAFYVATFNPISPGMTMRSNVTERNATFTDRNSVGKWMFVVMTWSHFDGNLTVRYYINQTPVSEGTLSGQTVQAGGAFCIGTSANGSIAGADGIQEGWINGALIGYRALSYGEVGLWSEEVMNKGMIVDFPTGTSAATTGGSGWRVSGSDIPAAAWNPFTGTVVLALTGTSAVYSKKQPIWY